MQIFIKFKDSLKNQGLIETINLIYRFIVNPILYKIRPSLKKLKKREFKRKYQFEIPYSPNFLPIDYLDLDNLINQIFKLKPKNVLELGTGYSTYALIFALMKLKETSNHEFNFWAVDQNEEYLNKVKAYLPEKFSNRINFLYRPVYADCIEPGVPCI